MRALRFLRIAGLRRCMAAIPEVTMDIVLRLASAFLILFLPLPTFAYDLPLSESSIRDAYFLGTREGALRPDLLSKYARHIPELKEEGGVSTARIETPFLQVADYSGRVPNYSAQDAVKDSYEKPLVFRIRLDICYELDAPQKAIRVRVMQNKREVLPLLFESSPYSLITDFGTQPPNGEQIVLEFTPSKITSSDLTILIDTSDGQHAETVFDLQSIR
jgi:hypothetical protein